MKNIRNELKHKTKTVMIIAALFTMSCVLTDSASALVIGPAGIFAPPQAPVQSIVRPPIGVGVQSCVRPPLFNPFFRPPVFNPFFRPAVFNPFFRPVFNPFFGADLDGVGLGFGVGIGAGAVD